MISTPSPLSAFLGQLIVDSKHFMTAPLDLLVCQPQQEQVQDLHQQFRASDLELVCDNAKIFHERHPRRATYPKPCIRRSHTAIEALGTLSLHRWDDHCGESSSISLQDSPCKPMGRKQLDPENDPCMSRWAPLNGENPKCDGLICPSRRKNSITDDVVVSSPLASASTLSLSHSIISPPPFPPFKSHWLPLLLLRRHHFTDTRPILHMDEACLELQPFERTLVEAISFVDRGIDIAKHLATACIAMRKGALTLLVFLTK